LYALCDAWPEASSEIHEIPAENLPDEVIGPIVNARDQAVDAGSQILPSLDLFRPTRQPLPANR